MTQTSHLKRVMGTPSLVFFGLAYMVPLTIFTTYGEAVKVSDGHLPAAYVVTLGAMFFTAFSYASMVRAYPRAGSAYSYARRAFGGNIGFMTGWTLLLDYLLLPLINYLALGIYLSTALPQIPAWLYSAVAVAIVTVCNIVGMRVVKNSNFVLVSAQLVFAVVFVAVAIKYGIDNPGKSLLTPFYEAGLDMSAVFSASAILCLSFLGFDAVSTLSEEAHDPRRTVPRAIVLTTICGGVIFIVIAFASYLVQPDPAMITNTDNAAYELMTLAGGQWLEIFFIICYVGGCLASAMAAQVSVSRILYAMGRDGTLPRKVFGYLHPRFLTPTRSTVVVGVISLIGIFVNLSAIVHVISFGALAAFTLVNLSVPKHFLWDRGERGGGAWVRYGLLPLIGTALTAWLWTSLSSGALILGLSWMGVGFVYLVVLTRMFSRTTPEFGAIEEDEVIK